MHPPPTFSSSRERRLWMWLAAVVAAIYLTLGLGPELAGVAYGEVASAVAFVSGMLLVTATVLTLGLRWRPKGLEIGVAFGVVVAYGMVLLRLTLPERTHLIEYGVVAVFAYEALTERARHGRRVPVPALLAIALTSLIGTLDEALQAIIPSRIFDPVDILFNVLAAVMAVSASVFLGWARRAAQRARRAPSDTG